MSGLNRVMLIGRLGKNPETRYSKNGMAVCSFSVATSEQWTDKASGDRNEKTEWHNCVSFGKQADAMGKYLTKGSQIYIEGRLQTDSYEVEGGKKYSTKIIVSQFQFLDSKKQDHEPGGRPAPRQEQQPATTGTDDFGSDIPF